MTLIQAFLIRVETLAFTFNSCTIIRSTIKPKQDPRLARKFCRRLTWEVSVLEQGSATLPCHAIPNGPQKLDVLHTGLVMIPTEGMLTLICIKNCVVGALNDVKLNSAHS